MLEINWGPLVGAAVVHKKTWDRIPPEFRDEMLKVATETGKQVTASGRTESDQAVAAMVKRGLQVHKVTPEIDAEWRDMIEKIQDRIRGHVVPADAFDEAQRLLKEYRAQRDSGKK
jgi:TRAP-type C4-dicarboxylate transport system substrate-binding protein